PGDGAGSWDGDGLAGDVDRVRHLGQVEGEVLAVSEENSHLSAERKLLALETGERFVETGGGVGDLFAVRLGGLDDLIKRLYWLVEVGICLCQLLGDVLQTGFLSGRKRG